MSRLVPLFFLNVVVGTMEFLLPIKFSSAHVDIALTAVLFATSSFCSMVLDIPSGKLSDRVGRELLIAGFMVGVAGAALILYFSHTILLFFLAVIILGASYGLCWSPLLALIGDSPEDHGSAFGRFFRIAALGEGIAPLIVALIIVKSDINIPFLLVVGIALVGLLFIWLEPRQKIIPNTLRAEETSYRSALALVRKSLPINLFLIATGFFVAFFWESVWFSQPLVGFYSDSLLASAFIVAAFALPSLFFSDAIGFFIQKYGERRVYITSALLAVLSFLAFYLSTLLLAKIIFIFAAAIGVDGIWIVMDTLTARLHGAEVRGEFFGTIETMRDVAYLISPLFIAATYPLIGLDGVFAVNAGAALILFGWALYAFRFDKKAAVVIPV